MKFSSLIFENIENKTDEYFLNIVRETIIDIFASQNINLFSFQRRINHLVFENEKTTYEIFIKIENNNVIYSLYGYLTKRSIEAGGTEVQKQFTNEDDLVENTKKIIENFIQKIKEAEEKINKVEDIFEEFFKSIEISLPPTIEIWSEPVDVVIIENDFQIIKKSRVFISRQFLGRFLVTYDADTNFPSPDIYLELLSDQRNYKTFEELLTLGRDFVVQTLTKGYDE